LIRHISLALCLGGVVVVACTRSTPSGSGSGLLPEQIAQTLTAAPTLPPSRTPPPPPTAQPSPSPSALHTSPPTVSSSATPGPTATASPPPLPTDDPRFGLNLSVPDYSDEFQVRYGWFEYNDPGSATITWERGRLVTTDHRADGFLWWSTSGQTGADVYAEIAAAVGDCQGKDAYGIALRIGGAGYDRGYTLEISCDGHYRMRKFISGSSPETMVDWTAHTGIEQGPDVSNQIGFFAEGPTLIGFANGEALEPISDADFVFGNFALFSEAADSDTMTATFSQFVLWYLEP
jgi:hypothetical protein